MSNEWNVERLAALPEGTVIEWEQEGRKRQAVRRMNAWRVSGLAAVLYSGSVLADAVPDSIRVVSVPIDALLADGAVDAAQREAWVSDNEGWSVRHGIRAAVEHVTGHPHQEVQA